MKNQRPIRSKIRGRGSGGSSPNRKLHGTSALLSGRGNPRKRKTPPKHRRCGQNPPVSSSEESLAFASRLHLPSAPTFHAELHGCNAAPFCVNGAEITAVLCPDFWTTGAKKRGNPRARRPLRPALQPFRRAWQKPARLTAHGQALVPPQDQTLFLLTRIPAASSVQSCVKSLGRVP